jgi:hypothetical protein
MWHICHNSYKRAYSAARRKQSGHVAGDQDEDRRLVRRRARRPDARDQGARLAAYLASLNLNQLAELVGQLVRAGYEEATRAGGGRKAKRLVVREELNYLGRVLIEAYMAGNEIKYQQACSKIDKLLLRMGRGRRKRPGVTRRR